MLLLFVVDEPRFRAWVASLPTEEERRDARYCAGVWEDPTFPAGSPMDVLRQMDVYANGGEGFTVGDVAKFFGN